MYSLYDKLKNYHEKNVYPLHMPGHKRQALGEFPANILELDITEITDFDNLHQPETILKELQDRIGALFGAKKSYVLVNGSTSGILTAISALVSKGGTLLMGRNCHKSAYHGAYLRDLRVAYISQDKASDYEIYDSMDPAKVESMLQMHPELEAVLLVNPTYEGRISDINAIADIVHKYKKYLIVDEAHGAHLGLSPELHESSIRQGADIVIQSIHKTLPSMTQTALLHINERVYLEKLEQVERFLHIYQSSSPSYVLMASVDHCIHLLEEQGKELFQSFVRNWTSMAEALRSCQVLEFPFMEDKSQDIGKLIIGTKNQLLSGNQISTLLRTKYGLQLEMSAGQYGLAMFTIGDTEEGFLRCTQALLDMDSYLLSINPATLRELPQTYQEVKVAVLKERSEGGLPHQLTIGEAWEQELEWIPLEQAEHRIAGEFVSFYPPGSPILVPGEVITEEMLLSLKKGIAVGLDINGVKQD